MKITNPACPHCGRATGIVISIVISEFPTRDLASLWCARCQITTLLQPHDAEHCAECHRVEGHADGCSSDRPWGV